MELSIFCLFPLVLIVGLPSGEALECYECNSGDIYEKEACAKMKKGDKGFIQNCTALGEKDGLDYKRCRVVLQDVEGQVRTVRSCATWPDETKPSRCVDRTGTAKIKVRYCECDGDMCNESSRMTSSLFLFLATSLAVLFASNSLCR